MNDFTASNGVTLGHSLEGHILLPKSVMGLGEDTQQALREFFQAEADERLGRWRSTVDPGWTAVLDAGPQIIFFRHDDGIRAFDADPDGSGLSRWDSELQAVAREYFDAHPEPKPWHNAKQGEGWVIDVGSDDYPNPQAAVVSNEGKFLLRDGGSINVDRPYIRSGHRFYPEASS